MSEHEASRDACNADANEGILRHGTAMHGHVDRLKQGLIQGPRWATSDVIYELAFMIDMLPSPRLVQSSKSCFTTR